MTSQEVKEKIDERTKTRCELNKLNDQIKTKENNLSELKLWLLENCNHQWEYIRESSWDPSDYKCKTCNYYKSDKSKLIL